MNSYYSLFRNDHASIYKYRCDVTDRDVRTTAPSLRKLDERQPAELAQIDIEDLDDAWEVDCDTVREDELRVGQTRRQRFQEVWERLWIAVCSARLSPNPPALVMTGMPSRIPPHRIPPRWIPLPGNPKSPALLPRQSVSPSLASSRQR